MATERRYLKGYFSRREAEAFVDGAVAAGWLAAEMEVVPEQKDDPWAKTQYVVYHRVEKPDAPPVPSKTTSSPRRRFIR